MKKPKLTQFVDPTPFRFATVKDALEFHARPPMVYGSDEWKRYMNLTVPPYITDDSGRSKVNPAYMDAPLEEVYLAQEKSPYDKKD
jgi:hypothetical protein